MQSTRYTLKFHGIKIIRSERVIAFYTSAIRYALKYTAFNFPSSGLQISRIDGRNLSRPIKNISAEYSH